MSSRWKHWKTKTYRARRHFAALARYATPRRLANVAIVEAERLLGRDELRGRPYMLIIDPLNVCNLKCPLCPTGKGELPLKNGKMSLDQFRTLIDEIAPFAFKVMLYNWGEPFLHKDILAMVRHAHERRISTALSSNLNLIPKEGAEAIVEAGLDDLIISCDGLEQATYEKYRVGGKVEKVFENLRALAEAKRKLGRRNPHIEFQFLVFEHNEHEVPRVEQMARDAGADFVRIMPPYIGANDAGINPARSPEFRKNVGSGDDDDVFRPGADLARLSTKNPPPLKCFWPWRSIAINWNGQADPCCFKNYHQSFGNVFENGFGAVWNNEVYKYSRRWIAGRANGDSPYPIVCRGCRGYF